MLSGLHVGVGPSQLRAMARTRIPSVQVHSGKGFGAPLKTLLTPKPKMVNGRLLLEPGKVSPMRPVPDNIPKPSWYKTGVQPKWVEKTEVHDAEGIKKMRAAGKLAAQTLDFAGTLVRPGVTTDEIDAAVHKFITDNGAYPSPLNYGKFPKSVCTSVNECICHGIPDDRPLREGDIVNIDVTVLLDGYHGDTSRMYYVGEVSAEAKHLCEVTKQSLDAAIAICKPGVAVKEIGRVINEIADKHKMGVVRDFVGHGVGKVFHASPVVQHYRNNARDVMRENQTFTIEPMLVAPGGTLRSRMWKDKWTYVTADGSLTAQYEHTLLITRDGVEILTQC